MAQFQAINPAVEVNGQTVLSIANGLGTMKEMGLNILSKNGIPDPVAEHWYPQQKWLDAFKQISKEVGSQTLKIIGNSIPENADFPPEIDDIFKALSAIDVAYHMNHRLNNVIMFNPANGQMTEGIGHYHYKKISDNEIEIKCDNPYPCDFDLGIIESMAKRFKPAGAFLKIKHDTTIGCRKTGGSSCTYIITW